MDTHILLEDIVSFHIDEALAAGMTWKKYIEWLKYKNKMESMYEDELIRKQELEE